VVTDPQQKDHGAPTLVGDSANEQVLVLGGSGFIGLDTSLRLRRAGFKVRVLDLAQHDTTPLAVAGIELFAGAVEDRRLLDEALEGTNWVIHAVGSPPPAASASSHDPTADGLVGVGVLLEALQAHPGAALTFVSSGGAVYGDVPDGPIAEGHTCRPISPYGVSKLRAEQAIGAAAERYGLAARILRISNVYGPRQDASNGQGVIAAFLRAAQSGDRVPVFGGGRAIRDFVHVEDVARAVVAIRPSQAGPRVVNVGGGVGYSVAAVRKLVQELTGAQLNTHDLPWRSFDVPHIVLDVARLKGLMQWEPRELRTGIAQTWSGMHDELVTHDQLLA
jgi:UDP-glucose 4-epimerase